MRRKRQLLSDKDCVGLLRQGSAGVLAVAGDHGYPYAVPLSYVYDGDAIYFHCAPAGHKLDAILRDNRVSFCVIGQDQVVPAAYTTYYRSVIVFGRARVLEDPAEKRAALELLAAKYAPELPEGRTAEINKLIDRTCMVEIRIEHISGKQAVERI